MIYICVLIIPWNRFLVGVRGRGSLLEEPSTCKLLHRPDECLLFSVRTDALGHSRASIRVNLNNSTGQRVDTRTRFGHLLECSVSSVASRQRKYAAFAISEEYSRILINGNGFRSFRIVVSTSKNRNSIVWIRRLSILESTYYRLRFAKNICEF